MSKCQIARQKLTQYVQSLDQSGVEKVTQVGKLGLLANPKTPQRILGGNLASSLHWLARENTAAGVDYMLSLGKPDRRQSMSVFDVRAAKEFTRGVKHGIAKVRRHARTGMDPDLEPDLASMPRVQYKHAISQKLADAVGIVISATDKPFYEGVQRVSLYGRAKVMATREGLKGAAFKARVDELVRNPTEEMTFLSHADAAQVVARDETALAKLVNRGKGAARQMARKQVDPTLSPSQQLAARGEKLAGSALTAVGEGVAPFVTAPLSMAAGSVRASPVHTAAVLLQQLHPKMRSQRNLSRAVAGGGIMGVGGSALGWALASEGRMTGAEVTDEERRLGMQPYSVRIKSRWVPVAWLGPAAVMPVLGAVAYHYGKAHPEAGAVESAGAAAAGFPKMLTEQTFLKGVKETMAAVENPTRSANSLIPMAVRMPSAVGQVSRGLDPVVRETEKGPLKGGFQRVQAQTPGSKYLDARVGSFGEDITRHGGGLAGFLQSVLDPTSSTEAKDDPVYGELVRLKVPAAGLGKTIHILGKPQQRTPDDRRALVRKHGPELKRRLNQRMHTPLYERLPDEQKAQSLRTVMRDWQEMVSEQDRRRRVGRQ